MNEKEVRQQIVKATKLVEAWPAWKQNILAQSAQPSVTTPRPPVNNQAPSGDQQKKPQ